MAGALVGFMMGFPDASGSLASWQAAFRRNAISVTPYVVWGMRITHRYDGRRHPTLRYARIG